MKAFVDRYSSLKDKYSTGKEKREREGMDIRDKQQGDIFDMQDKFNARKQKIDSQMFRLKDQNNKLIATTGKSKQTEKNASDLSALAKEAEGLNTVASALDIEMNIYEKEMAIPQANIKMLQLYFNVEDYALVTKIASKLMIATNKENITDVVKSL